MKRAKAKLQQRIKRDRAYLRTKVNALARFASVTELVEQVTRSKEATPNQRAYRAWATYAARRAVVVERDDHAHRAPEVANFAADAIGKQSNPTPSIVAPSLDMHLPRSIEEAINDPGYAPQWREALAKEYTGFENKQCFQVVEHKAFMKPVLRFQPIFKVKRHSGGTLDKFKVRLVVGGHRAVKGQHLTTTRRSRP
jgi:hypothetical protein